METSMVKEGIEKWISWLSSWFPPTLNPTIFHHLQPCRTQGRNAHRGLARCGTGANHLGAPGDRGTGLPVFFFRNLTSKNIGENTRKMEKMGTYQWKFAKLVCFTSWWISVDLWYIDLDGVPLFERSRSLATMILDDMMITCIVKSLLWIQLESF